MRSAFPLIAVSMLWALAANSIDAFALSEFPKTVKVSSTRKVTLNPVAQPDGDLTRPTDTGLPEQPSAHGDTILQISVNARGAIADVTVLKSSGSRPLDSAAVENARTNWKFFPAMRNGVAVPSRRVETITWSPPQPAKQPPN